MIRNKPHINKISVDFNGQTRVAAKARGTSVLESSIEICSFGKHHLPTVVSFKNSSICVMDLPQSCDCRCGGTGRCITTKGLAPFDLSVGCLMENNLCGSYCESKNNIMKNEPSTDIMACEYTKNKAMSVELTTSVTCEMAPNVNRLSSVDSGIGNVYMSIRETITTCVSSHVTQNCALVSEMAQITVVREVSAAPQQNFYLWGTELEAAGLLPVSGCVYDAKGRIIRMTVHSQAVDSDSCSSNDSETEDVFELFWQPCEGDDEYFKNENSLDDDCPSDDSDVFICFEDPTTVQNCCAGVSVTLEPFNFDRSFVNKSSDTSQGFDYDNMNENKGCPKKRGKRVSFKSDSDLVEIHQMVAWNFAYHSARKGPWEREAADRAHFKQRIKEVEPILVPVIQKQLNKLSSEKTLN